jgi:hypothetical protein
MQTAGVGARPVAAARRRRAPPAPPAGAGGALACASAAAPQPRIWRPAPPPAAAGARAATARRARAERGTADPDAGEEFSQARAPLPLRPAPHAPPAASPMRPRLRAALTRPHAAQSAVLLIGFAPDEVPLLQEMAGPDTPVLLVAGRALNGPPELALLASQLSPDLVPFAGAAARRAADAPARCVLSSGAAAGDAANLKAALLAAGLQPAVFGALRPAHRGQPLSEVAAEMLAAHESYWRLLRPVQVRETEWEPDAVRVAMNVTIDGGAVDDTRGGERFDAGHVVVLDGLVDEAVRAELLDAITMPGWCVRCRAHAGRMRRACGRGGAARGRG